MQTVFCNPDGHGQCCVHYPTRCPAPDRCHSVNESVLSDKDIWTTHYHRSGTCFGVQFVAWRQHLSCRNGKLHNTYQHLFPWHFTCSLYVHQLAMNFHWCGTLQSKNENIPLTSICGHVCRRRAIFKLIVQRDDKLMKTSHGCMTTKTNYTYLLRCEILCQIMLFHVKALLLLLFLVNPLNAVPSKREVR
jgi:hypothetical protein